jgi:outer membrane protein assembly factor BamD
MNFRNNVLVALVILGSFAVSGFGWGFKRKKYENPIAKASEQPDKTLFDKAIRDIEHSRYETARLTLNTLINTYDSSEYLAKSKLAIADSWMRQGGTEGLAQAEAEFKDFQLFYPTMPEAPEAQSKICEIHFMRMEKSDRDPNNALRAEQECKGLLERYPNAKFAPSTENRLRQIQEVLAQAEAVTGRYYYKKGSYAAAANRFSGVVNQYPLFSDADEALWFAADAYTHMGDRFKKRAYDSYAKIVRDYPLSQYAELSKKKLQSAEQEIPAADPKAVERMKYEAENRTKPGVIQRSTSFMKRGPDVSSAAKTGTPTMESPKREIPATVPVPADAAGFSGDVTVAPVTDSTALDTKPDARTTPAPAAPAKK